MVYRHLRNNRLMKKFLCFFMFMVNALVIGANNVTSSKILTVGRQTYVAYSLTGNYTYYKITNNDESIVDAYLQSSGSNYTYLYLTGKNIGYTTVIISKWNNSQNRWDHDNYNITVVDVTNIEIPKTQSVVLGNTYKFEPIISDSRATTTLTWNSTNQSVATITQEGILTAQELGTTTVSCTAHNGVSAQCVVTVTPVLATSITLSKSKVSMVEGKVYTLTATVLPENTTDKSVKWKSSNSNVVTVNSNGKMTAVKEGTATVTATTADGSNLKASCTVTVTPVVATSITLSKSAVSMKIGKIYQLTATVLPENVANNSVLWKSSDTNIVTVDANGLLTGIKEGLATITATTADGSNLSATCEVTVSPFVVTSVSLDNTTLALPIGKTATLKATVTPSNATYKTLKWTSSNVKVATITQEGLVTAVKAGTATITATSTDGTNLSATCKVNVKDYSLTPVSTSVTPGEQVRYPFKMSNEEPIAGLQCDIVIPQGIEVAGKTLSSKRAPDHTISYNKLPDSDTTYRVVILSTSGDIIASNSGTLFSLTLSVGKNQPEASLPVKVCNAILTTEGGEKIYPADAEATLEVTGPQKGDVNNDGAIDIADAIAIVNHILQKETAVFFENAADVNNDNAIDIADAISVINIILKK